MVAVAVSGGTKPTNTHGWQGVLTKLVDACHGLLHTECGLHLCWLLASFVDGMEAEHMQAMHSCMLYLQVMQPTNQQCLLRMLPCACSSFQCATSCTKQQQRGALSSSPTTLQHVKI